ncbi:MAG: aminoacyl-tRNA hydrolase [Cellulosilyticaceae bacterium]
MKLIVGLGNPGNKYASTRHNVGFEAIDVMADLCNISVTRNKFKALVGEGTIGNEKVVLMKPQTYMNLSGESVGEAATWYKIAPDDIIIIYDDVSLEAGQIRIRKTGSAGGHNGIKSIIAHLGVQTFPRIKIGVGEKPDGWDLADHVLGKFSQEEMKELVPRLKDVAKAVELMIEKDTDTAMNMYNSKLRR